MKTADQKPRLLVVAGPNGAGKTTVTERGLAHEWFSGCEYINPDFIARDEFSTTNLGKMSTVQKQKNKVIQPKQQRVKLRIVLKYILKVGFLI